MVTLQLAWEGSSYISPVEHSQSYLLTTVDSNLLHILLTNKVIEGCVIWKYGIYWRDTQSSHSVYNDYCIKHGLTIDACWKQPSPLRLHWQYKISESYVLMDS